ncbi:MAG: CoA-binding protein [Bacteroidetes bacterium]|nr:CoA-binding protein [Bacteroidota bacterium]
MDYSNAKDYKVLVMGASENVGRYSNRAIKLLLQYNFEVVALGNREGKVESVSIQKGMVPFENVHTVTMYLGAANQKSYYDYIVSLKPKRVIFNPGAENPELEKLLAENGIEFEEACTLVLLNTGHFLS